MTGALPSPTTFGLFAVTAVALVAIPGPNMLYILSRGVTYGRPAAYASAIGVELGTLVHVFGTVVGVSALVAASAVAFNTVKYAGAAYLVYLGVRALLSRSGLQLDTSTARPRPLLAVLRQGALVNVLNPKVALFFLALLPQYIDAGRGPVATQTLALGGTFFAIALAMDLVYATVSGAIGRWLRRRPALARGQRYVAGLTYLGLGVAAASARR
jgi:threonine/homoserine/homoserine lactone efflux protein